MANLNSILLDADRIKGGAWVTIHTGDGDSFEIRTRGYTPKFKDTLAELKLAKVRALNKGTEPGEWIITPDTLPPSVDDECIGKALAAECFMDVRGLTHADERAVTADEFKALLVDPVRGAAIIRLTHQAAGSVAVAREGEIADAVGN